MLYCAKLLVQHSLLRQPCQIQARKTKKEVGRWDPFLYLLICDALLPKRMLLNEIKKSGLFRCGTQRIRVTA